MLKLFAQNSNFRSMLMFSTFGGIGRGMFSIFMMWAVHALYQNPMYTGIAGFMFGLPLVISFVVGPFIDRWNKAKVLRAVEFTKFVIVTLILLSYIFFNPGVWFLFISILVFSIATLFGGPAFTALLPKVVDGDDLVKANVMMNITAIVGGLGVAAGLMILLANDGDFAWIYGLNAAMLFIAVLFTLLLRYSEPATTLSKEKKSVVKAYFDELKLGFSFAKTKVMLPLVSAIVAMGIFANAANVNFPMFAEVHFGAAFGFILLSALALTGDLIGSILCRAVASVFTLGKILIIGFFMTGAVRILFVNVIGINLVGGVLIYVLYVGFVSTIGIFYHILLQKLPPKDIIGRVATTSTSLTAIATTVGALVGGLLGTHFDVDTVFIIQGSSYIVIGVLLCFSHIRKLPKIKEIGKSGDS
ncbi:MAG: MFS transporter [Firmicutes bacterium]|nr:MFS transporter [Bacillota bacterium]